MLAPLTSVPGLPSSILPILILTSSVEPGNPGKTNPDVLACREGPGALGCLKHH